MAVALSVFFLKASGMGVLFSSLFGRLFGTKEVRILILGLDNAGKTTILWVPRSTLWRPNCQLWEARFLDDRLQVDDIVQTIPTIGFNVETIQVKNVKLQVWDLGKMAATPAGGAVPLAGGQSSIRPYWRCYYPNTNGIVYVVDSADRDRLPDARRELNNLLDEEELQGVALLVFANKQDLPDAMSSVEVSEGLGLTQIRYLRIGRGKLSGEFVASCQISSMGDISSQCSSRRWYQRRIRLVRLLYDFFENVVAGIRTRDLSGASYADVESPLF